MRGFLGTVLSVIAVGVLLIAYGLLSPRAAAAPWGPPSGTTDPYASPYANPYQTARPVPASDIVSLGQAGYDPYAAARAGVAYPVSDVRTVRTVRTGPAPVRRTVATQVERSSGRNWKKTALVIGGTTAAGAGLGAIFGGGKGALIGAAIGGGASTIYEATKH
jgi:outer membrane lipoprotein SlyB